MSLLDTINGVPGSFVHQTVMGSSGTNTRRPIIVLVKSVERPSILKIHPLNREWASTVRASANILHKDKRQRLRAKVTTTDIY